MCDLYGRKGCPTWKGATLGLIFWYCSPKHLNNIWIRAHAFAFCTRPCRLCSCPLCNQILYQYSLVLKLSLTFNPKASVLCKNMSCSLFSTFLFLKFRKRNSQGETSMVFLWVTWLLSLTTIILFFLKHANIVATASYITWPHISPHQQKKYTKYPYYFTYIQWL